MDLDFLNNSITKKSQVVQKLNRDERCSRVSGENVALTFFLAIYENIYSFALMNHES